MISYGGIKLCDVTPAMALAVERVISPRDVYQFERASWPGKNRVGWTWPGFVPDRAIKVGSLWWPRGATRWAVGHFLATEEQLESIRPQVYSGPGNTYQSLPCVLSQERADGATVGAITTNLWMLPPRPLFQCEALSDYERQQYLVTLVDDRYWWQFATTTDLIVTDGSTTWQALYTTVAANLGISDFANDPISPAYLCPAGALTNHYERAAPLLDLIAYNVGQRIVRNLDGSVYAMEPQTAEGVLAADLANNWPVKAGGEFLFAASDLPNDLNAILPTTVAVSFPTSSGSYVVFTANLSSLTPPGLPSGLTGNGAQQLWHDVATCYVAPASNTAALQALVNQFASDWYAWQSGPLDLALVGIRDWLPEGLTDTIEWTYRGEQDCSTRLQRRQWNDLAEELLTCTPPPTTPPSSSCCGQPCYQVTLSGITSSGVAGCAQLNGTYLMYASSAFGGCSWIGYNANGVQGTLEQFGNRMNFFADNLIEWGTGNWSCSGGVLNLVVTGCDKATTPPTITVVPCGSSSSSGSAAAPSGSASTSASAAPVGCGGITRTLETVWDTYCIAGVLEVWKQIEKFVGGCLQSVGDPFFSHFAGCCVCPAPGPSPSGSSSSSGSAAFPGCVYCPECGDLNGAGVANMSGSWTVQPAQGTFANDPTGQCLTNCNRWNSPVTLNLVANYGSVCVFQDADAQVSLFYSPQWGTWVVEYTTECVSALYVSYSLWQCCPSNPASNTLIEAQFVGGNPPVGCGSFPALITAAPLATCCPQNCCNVPCFQFSLPAGFSLNNTTCNLVGGTYQLYQQAPCVWVGTNGNGITAVLYQFGPSQQYAVLAIDTVLTYANLAWDCSNPTLTLTYSACNNTLGGPFGPATITLVPCTTASGSASSTSASAGGSAGPSASASSGSTGGPPCCLPGPRAVTTYAAGPQDPPCFSIKTPAHQAGDLLVIATIGDVQDYGGPIACPPGFQIGQSVSYGGAYALQSFLRVATGAEQSSYQLCNPPVGPGGPDVGCHACIFAALANVTYGGKPAGVSLGSGNTLSTQQGGASGQGPNSFAFAIFGTSQPQGMTINLPLDPLAGVIGGDCFSLAVGTQYVPGTVVGQPPYTATQPGAFPWATILYNFPVVCPPCPGGCCPNPCYQFTISGLIGVCASENGCYQINWVGGSGTIYDPCTWTGTNLCNPGVVAKLQQWTTYNGQLRAILYINVPGGVSDQSQAYQTFAWTCNGACLENAENLFPCNWPPKVCLTACTGCPPCGSQSGSSSSGSLSSGSASSGSAGGALDCNICPPGFLPANITATFSAQGPCACLNGLSIPMTCGPIGCTGSAPNPCGGGTINVGLQCSTNQQWTFTVNLSTGGGTATATNPTGTCSPFKFVFANIDMSAAAICFGSASVTLQ